MRVTRCARDRGWIGRVRETGRDGRARETRGLLTDFFLYSRRDDDVDTRR